MPDVGRKASGKHTQSVVFEKSAGWTEPKSRAWCKEHDYYTDGHDETETQHRWRQYDPDDEKFRYRAQVIKPRSISLILGFPKGSSAKGENETMSLASTLKKVEDAKIGLESELATAQASITERDIQLTELRSQLDNLKAEQVKVVEAATAKQAELEAAIAVLQTELTSKGETLKVLEVKHAELQKILNRPEYADLKGSGETKVTASVREAATGSEIPHWDAYNSLTHPKAKTAYWNEHESELRNEQVRIGKARA